MITPAVTLPGHCRALTGFLSSACAREWTGQWAELCQEFVSES